jgi:hypothetical protein
MHNEELIDPIYILISLLHQEILLWIIFVPPYLFIYFKLDIYIF